MAEPIQVVCVYPPIPVRSFDYCAYRDPERRQGFGATEADAIADLLQQEEDDDDV